MRLTARSNRNRRELRKGAPLFFAERSGPNVVVEKLSMLPVDGEPKSMDLTGERE